MNMLQSVPLSIQTVLLLVCSSVFMTMSGLAGARDRIGYQSKLNLVWAALCMVVAVYFIFRGA